MSLDKKGRHEIVKKDIEVLYLGNLKTVTFDLQLPRKGVYGSDICWESHNQKFLSNDGKVVRPVYGMGNRKVTLTGIFSSGTVVEKKDYQVMILEREDPYKDESACHEVEIKRVEDIDISKRVCECSDTQIRILPGNEFYENQERMRRYLLGIEDDSMLYPFRKASGMDTRGAESPGGWDAPECKLRGHTTGHYLSALSLCYHAVGDERIREKAEYMVRELDKCQKAFSEREDIKEGFLSGYSEEQFDLLEQYTPYPEIWAPYYTLHKIIAGLLDCYNYIGSKQALEIAAGMGMWTWKRLSVLPKAQLKKMWGMYIAGEFGGMNAVMAQLAGITGKEEFVKCAALFDNEKLFAPLLKYQDRLGGMHANQHIPQILGAIEIYKITGRKSYLEIARVFWKTVTKNRAYAPGGVGENEMFQEYGKMGSLLTANTQETCASYNMLKLTKELYQIEPDAEYMDYYERTLFNHIAAVTAKDDSGESTYFFPLGPGMHREFLRENSCCHGTGMESPFRYREGIYYHQGEDLYINLYIPSEISDDKQHIKIRMECVSKRNQCYRIEVQSEQIRRIYLRKPEWSSEATLRELEKAHLAETEEDRYLVINGDFSGGKKFEVCWNPRFVFRRTQDEPEKTAIQYGPYLLAILSEEREFIRISLDEVSIYKKMKWKREDADELHFQCEDQTWIPLCEVDDSPYHVYVICE